MNYDRAILKEYEQKKEIYLRLENHVASLLSSKMKENGIKLMELTHRLKSRESLANKIIKKDKYRNLTDITDVVGLRLVAFFADDVDLIASLVQEHFNMDWDNTVDKSAALSPTAFGYTSLHYVCSIPDTEEFADCHEEFKDIRFEIQIRTALQHVWAEIEHDLGYKSEFGVPTSIRREFSRIAGLLEIVDERFNYIRTDVNDYILETRDKIRNDLGTDIPVDQVSLKEYMYNNVWVQSLIEEISNVTGIDVEHVDPFPHLRNLEFLSIHTLGELSDLVERNWDLTIAYAKDTLTKRDIDHLSSNVILRYICFSELIRARYSKKKIERFFKITATTPNQIQANNKVLTDMAKKYMEMQAEHA